MRKCIITTNVQTVRTDEELQALWEKGLQEYNNNTMPGVGMRIDPSIASIERNSFYKCNRSYCEKKEVLGLFHQWGTDYEEFDNGAGNYTVAVVELVDGTIVTHGVDKIKFLPPDANGFREFAKMGHQNLGRMMY